jgi:predicted nucleic acid-binding protein
MRGKPFFDTNVLIYAVVDGDARADVARALLAGGGVLSVQVLNEFVAVARRKLKLPWNEIVRSLEDFRVLCEEPVAITIQVHEAALEIAERYGYTIYDSLVIAAALESGCKTLYSEDMHSGQKIEGLTILNPFQEDLR